VRSWPLLVLAAPAAVAVWSGWVGIGQMTGFGEIRPLPGIWNSLHIDTAVTLPVGVEAHAAFALRAWLTNSPAVSDRTRRFARWSAIAALVLGMAGQVAYHLLSQAGMTRAPWEVTTLVSCLPVLVFGLGSALAHLLRSDAAAASITCHLEEHAVEPWTSRQWVACQPPANQTSHTQPGLGRPPARIRADADPEAAAWLLLSILSARPLRAAMPDRDRIEPGIGALVLQALVSSVPMLSHPGKEQHGDQHR
jgi:hypothetical protein